MGVKLFSWVRRCFLSPNSIKVYNTNPRVQIQGAAFCRGPIKLSGCEGGLEVVILGWRAFTIPKPRLCLSNAGFFVSFSGNERFYRKQPGRMTTIKLESILVFMFVEGSVEEMSYDNNDDQQNHKDHRGV